MSHYQSFLRTVANSKEPTPSTPVVRKPANTTPLSPTPYTPSVNTVGSISTRSAPQTPASTDLSLPPAPQSTPATDDARPSPSPLTRAQISSALQATLTLQTAAVTQHSKRPFAAILIGPDNTTTLLTHFSISHIQHAESELARLASQHFSQTYLSTCTLVSTWEPCAMCAGTIYWAGIGRVLYAASETKLKDLTGADNPENLTMNMPCRKIFGAGQRKVEVIGPVSEGGWEDRIVEESGRWWKEHLHHSNNQTTNGSSSGSNGFFRDSRAGSDEMGHPRPYGSPGYVNGNISLTQIIATDDSSHGSIGEDGEYKADLDIDWMR